MKIKSFILFPLLFIAVGVETIKAKRHWQLSADGKTLTIDITLSNSQGEIKSKRVFTKA